MFHQSHWQMLTALVFMCLVLLAALAFLAIDIIAGDMRHLPFISVFGVYTAGVLSHSGYQYYQRRKAGGKK